MNWVNTCNDFAMMTALSTLSCYYEDPWKISKVDEKLVVEEKMGMTVNQGSEQKNIIVQKY